MSNDVRFGRDTSGGGIGSVKTVHSPDRFESWKTTFIASSVKEESTWKNRRASKLQLRSISEVAFVIAGSRGNGEREMLCTWGHSFGRLIIIDATITAEEPSANPISILVVM
jgi:hypothetical protein